MDILQRPTFWINGICYIRSDGIEEIGSTQSYDGAGDTIDEYDDFVAEAEVEVDFELVDKVEQLPNGRFRLGLDIATAFFAYIIGKKGATKKRIEMETRTRIDIPKQSQQIDDFGLVTINGDSKSSVCCAGNRILLLVQSARNRQEFTHFISLPLNSPEMKEALRRLKVDILQSECGNQRGVHENVFQDEDLLHLTIGTMVLMDSRERRRAAEMLQDCKEDILLPIIGENPIPVHVKGLEIMNDDPGEVDVVYAKVTPTTNVDTLQEIADKLVDKFCSAGLMTKQHDRVKIHLTVMNSLFGSREGGARKTLDASKILEQFGDFDFCSTVINEVHLSQRRTGGKSKDGYYKASAVVSLKSCA